MKKAQRPNSIHTIVLIVQLLITTFLFGQDKWHMKIPPEIDSIFVKASEEFNVPVDILRAIGHIESIGTFSQRDGKPSYDSSYDDSSYDFLYGIMGLRRRNDRSSTLLEASELLKVPASKCISNPIYNIRGAAAILNKYFLLEFNDVNKSDRNDIHSWVIPIEKYRFFPYNNRTIKYYLHEIYKSLEEAGYEVDYDNIGLMDAHENKLKRKEMLDLRKKRREKPIIDLEKKVTKLINKLNDKRLDNYNEFESVRAEMAFLLAQTLSPRAVEPLINTLLNDNFADVRSASATALSCIGDIRAITPLKKALIKDESTMVRLKTSLALIKLGEGNNRNVISCLTKIAKGKDIENWDLRGTGVHRIKKQEGENVFIEISKQIEDNWRKESITGLGKINTTESKTVLKSLLNDEKDFIRNKARKELEK